MKIRKSSAKDLIEQKLKEMPMTPDSVEYNYVCLDSGMNFCTYDEPASFSPFTGSGNFESTDVELEPEYSDEYSNGFDDYAYPYEAVDPAVMKPTGLPPSQANMQMQKPLAPNPVPAQTMPLGQNTPWNPNPAPDAQGMIGATQANPQGFVPAPMPAPGAEKVPPYKDKKPGDRTDQAPSGSK